MFNLNDRVILLADGQVYVVIAVYSASNTYDIRLENGTTIQYGVPFGGMKIATG